MRGVLDIGGNDKSGKYSGRPFFTQRKVALALASIVKHQVVAGQSAMLAVRFRGKANLC
jgi:hypothetical protein